MNSAVLDALMDSPALPEILEQARRALIMEQKRRQKFYSEITPELKWEFIQGQVIMHSPAAHRHLQATKRLFSLMDAHVRVNNLGIVHIEKALCVFPRNDYEPDIAFFGTAKAALTDADTLKFPIPDLIVEVLSPSTEARDRGIKFLDYALHGVSEYWIIDPVAETVELHRLSGDLYPPVSPQSEGLLTSDVIAGFEVPTRALFDEEENTRILREIWSQQ